MHFIHFRPKFFNKSKFRSSYFILIMLFSYIYVKPAQAEYGVAFGYGYQSNLYAYRLSIQKETCLQCGPITSYWEASANFIKYRPKRTSPNLNLNNKLSGASLAYVFHFQTTDSRTLPCSKKQLIPYADAGLGIALFNKKVIAGKRLGLNSLFEVKLGVGWRFGKNLEYDFSYKFIHYSNAYLANYNDGINLNFLVFNYWF